MPTDTTNVAVAERATTETQPAREGFDDRVTVIRPPTRLPRLDVRELWAYRELLGIFVWRDLKVRYKQTAVGAAWAIFQPILIAVVYTVVFGRFAKFPSGGIDYPVFVFAGLLPLLYFTSSLTSGATALVNNVNLVTKVYFPRLLLPLSSVVVPIVDLLLGCCVLAGLMVIYDTYPDGWKVLLAPAFLALAVVTAVGTSFGLSAVNVRYRDVMYAMPVFLQVLPLLSGAPYALDSLPVKWQWILSLNPLSAVVAGWRWCLIDGAEPNWAQTALGVAVALVLLVLGLAYFRRSEPRFADTI